uniref:Uncharacterized protein n=1 Tax=Panagrolaimus superbus TaxID=310955 RepID=A0A914YUK6_9BILA
MKNVNRISSLAILQRVIAAKCSYDRNVNERFAAFDVIESNLVRRQLGSNGIGCLEYTCYNVYQATQFLKLHGALRLRLYSDPEISELVQVIAKTILRTLFANSASGGPFEKSDGSNRYLALSLCLNMFEEVL